MPQIFKFDHLELDKNVIAALAALEELWPEEVRLVDYLEVTCSSPRARLAVGAIAGVQNDDPETDHTILNEATAEKIDVKPASPEDWHNETIEILDGVKYNCAVCGQFFTPKRATSKFCSKACAQKDYNTKYQAKKNGYKVGADPDQERETARMITSARSGQLHGRKL